MKLGYFRNNAVPWFVFFLLVFAIPITVKLSQEVQIYMAKAAVVPASIVVDASLNQGFLPRVWEAVAQGGELEYDLKSLVKVSPVLARTRQLNIKYVRLDHILNWPLEERIAEIKKIKDTGAVPVIALTYFPQNASRTDTGQPYNWGAWEEAVSNLVVRISGPKNLNLMDVYYEIWNEPDGKTFGDMSPEQYINLYRHTLNALNKVAPRVNPFKVGGPSLADPNKTWWLEKFIKLADEQSLRMDFISWHRYHRDVTVFTKDLDFVDSLLTTHPQYLNAEKLITEWGSDPAANLVHSTNFDAAHFLAVTRAILGRVNIAFKFEARDGAGDADNNKGLGILTYHGKEKPLSKIYAILTKMTGQRASLSGEGSNVTGFAVKDDRGIKIILANYDRRSLNTEEVPISINNLGPGTWQIKKTVLDGYNPYGREEKNELSLPSGSMSFSQVMLPNSVLFLELERQ